VHPGHNADGPYRRRRKIIIRRNQVLDGMKIVNCFLGNGAWREFVWLQTGCRESVNKLL
jgi:hypothetical protein